MGLNLNRGFLPNDVAMRLREQGYFKAKEGREKGKEKDNKIEGLRRKREKIENKNDFGSMDSNLDRFP